MTHLVLGVIGHVDHGKTALVRALTGQDTDRLPEEKQRGISIALGFAHLTFARDIGMDLIDMPGHERFVRTMIAGATGIDAVLVVVAANEGIKPQTLEHVEIASLLGLRRAVVAISKTDLATPQEAQHTADEVTRLLERSGLRPLAAVMTSVPQYQGIDELRQALGTLVAGHQRRSADGQLFLPIDRAFSMTGHGPVVTGTLRGACVKAGDTLELLPACTAVRVRALQVNGMRVAVARPGQRVAVNLRDIGITQLARGMSLAATGTLAPGEWLTLAIRAVDSAPALKNGIKLRALLGTDELDARLRLLDRDVLEPGDSGFAQLRCATAVALPVGEHVVLRFTSPARTVAGGRILESATTRLPRHRPAILEHLEELRTLQPSALITAELRRAGHAGVTLQHLSRVTALSEQAVAGLLQMMAVVVSRSGLVLQQTDMDALLACVPALLAKHASGLPPERLLSEVPRLSPALLEEVVALLLTRGVISKRGSQLVIPSEDADRARARSETKLASTIADKLRRGGLTPPTPSEVVKDLPSKRAVDGLLKQGILVRAVDRAKGREILFHQDAIADAQRLLAPLLEQPPGLLVTEIGAALGISRKFSMPLLDHLDAIRFTRRINDRRIRGVR